MTRLILGTAEFNPIGYGGNPPVEEWMIKDILGLAKEVGINIIDTAESYNCQDVIKRYAKGFCIYTKTRDWKVSLDWGDNELRGILYHYTQVESPIKLPFIHRWVNLGVSVYSPSQLPEEKNRILQIPYNIDTPKDKFKYVFNEYRTVFVRSVFGNGECLKTHTMKECLDYVSNLRADGIIVGVRSVKELKEILDASKI